MSKLIHQTYGNRIRNRACGICQQEGKYLLINHQGLGKPDFWSPVGGGIEFGETAQNALIREFEEEAGLRIQVLDFLYVSEFIGLPLHAYEFFFSVKILAGKLVQGYDPELPKNQQLIHEIAWLSWAEIQQIPHECKHAIFWDTQPKFLRTNHSFYC